MRMIIATVLAAAAATTADAQQPLKVFISADMEGVAGVVSPDQLGPAGFEYQRFREFMTAEVNAAIEGARAAGATDIVVADSHGNMQNLLIDRLPADVTVIRGSGRPLGMIHGIDSSFHAIVFLGYHSATTNLHGVRAHTFASARYTAVELNGRMLAESTFNAALAGHFGVPVVAISGDDAAVAEFLEIVPEAAGAVVKQAIGFHAAATRTPEAAQALIREAVRTGLSRRANIRPFRIAAPYSLELTFKNYRAAEVLAYLPIVERATAHSIRFRATSIPDIARFLAFVGTYSPDIDP
ncbi:MAG TPA: M55 family metallopeptidase [Longimicrobiales bacterium]|nr:M55 family metallopeptidase [Longimicrobiales bacterium]